MAADPPPPGGRKGEPYSTLDLRLRAPREELLRALSELVARSPETQVELQRPRRYPRRLGVPLSGGVVRVVDLAEVSWIEAASQYCRIHTSERSFLLRRSLVALEESLDPQHFRRVHRSAIVNLDRVVELHTLSPTLRRLALDSGGTVPVSPRAWADLQEDLFAGA